MIEGVKMRSKAPGLIRSPAITAMFALFGLLPLAGCETPPSGVPTAADIRGLRPSGTVTMTQFFVSGTGGRERNPRLQGQELPVHAHPLAQWRRRPGHDASVGRGL